MRGSRIRLGALRDEDADAMFEWINDRELVELSSSFEPVDRDSHLRWFVQIRNRPDVEIFAIRLGEDGRLIGSCQLNEIDRAGRSAKLQIRIGDPEGRDQGLGTEAVELLLHHAFGELGLERVTLDVFNTNARAIRAYEKAGFVRRGVRKGGAVIAGEPVDVIEMTATPPGEDAGP